MAINDIVIELGKAAVYIFCVLLVNEISRRRSVIGVSMSWSDLLNAIPQLIFIFRTNVSTGDMKLFPLTPNRVHYFDIQAESDTVEKGLDSRDYLHPDDRKHASMEGFECVSAKIPYNYHKRIKGPGNKYKWIRVKSNYLKDEGDVAVWLGLMDDASDHSLFDELEHSRSMSRALEQILALNFDKIVTVDQAGMILQDGPQTSAARECILDWLDSDADKVAVQHRISNALCCDQRPLPFMMEADFHFTLNRAAVRHQIYIVSTARTGRVLVCIKALVPRRGVELNDLPLIDIPVDGDITELAGFFYSILDEADRAEFTRVWNRQIIEECLDCFEHTKVGNLNIMTPLQQPFSENSRAVTAVFMFVGLATIAKLESIDRVSVYMHACDRALALGDKTLSAKCCF